MCKINAANKKAVAVLNPVTMVFNVTSLHYTDPEYKLKYEINGTRKAMSIQEYSFQETTDALRDISVKRRLLQSEGPPTTMDTGTENKLPSVFTGKLFNDYYRDYNVIDGVIFDDMHWQDIQPLEIAKIYFDLRDLPGLMKYNEYFSIIITNDNDEEYTLPYYFHPNNDEKTNKTSLLTIRVFNF